MTEQVLQTAAAPPFRSRMPIVAVGVVAAAVIGVALAVNLRLGAGGVLVLVYGPLALLNFPLAVLVWLPLVFLNRIPVVGLAQTTMLLILAGAWIGVLLARTDELRKLLAQHRSLIGALVLLLAWLGLSMLWARDAGAAATAWGNWWISGAVMLLIATTFVTPRYAVLACSAFVVGALLTVAVGLVPEATAHFEVTGDEALRVSGALGDPNFLAAGLVPAAALAAGLMGMTRSSTVRVLLIGAIAVIAVNLVATGSRGGVFAMAVVVAAALVVARGRRLQLGGIVLVMLALSAAWVGGTSSETWDRIRDFQTNTGREDLWTVAWRMSEDNPIIGVGVHNFREESGQYVRQPGQLEQAEQVVVVPQEVHNIYLEQLAETGVVGLALLLSVVALVLRANWTAALRFEAAGRSGLAGLARAVLVAQLGTLSASIFLSNVNDVRLWILLALGPALAAAATRMPLAAGPVTADATSSDSVPAALDVVRPR